MHLQKFWLLTLFGILIMSGCGGGGSEPLNLTTDDPLSVSGKVADGYLVGATVFSDQNGNKQWDDGEPKSITEAGGFYTLEGANIDKHPIVVRVDADVIDEDTNTQVGKKYILSTPAGKPEFISPLTTLAQQQMEQNPTITTEQAEKVVMNQSGSDAGLSIYKDFMVEKQINPEYEKMHKVARVVAATFGDIQEQVETAATNAGYNTEEVLDALVQIVVDRVMAKLTDIAINIEESKDLFDPVVIADGISSIIEAESPVSETISDEIEAANTPVVVSTFKTLLENGGTYWIWYDYDLGFDYMNLEYGNLTLGSEQTLNENTYEYNFNTDQWIAGYDDGAYLLTESGWKWSSDGPEAGTIIFNDDGTATWTSTVDGARSKISAVEVDLAGKKMSTFAGRVKPLLADPDLLFPNGSKGWKLTFEDMDEAYEVKIWKNSETDSDDNFVSFWDSNGENVVSTLAEMRSAFAYRSTNYWHFEEWELQFDNSGMVYVYNGESYPYVLEEIGTWSEKTINDQKAMVLDLSDVVKWRSSIEGIPFYIEWKDGTVKVGEYYPAGNVHVDSDLEFNKVAFDSIFSNLAIGDATKIAMFDYFGYTPGEIRVYQGTWDTNDIRVEKLGQSTNMIIDGISRLVFPTESYNYNPSTGILNHVFTAYEYSDGDEYFLWKEVDADGAENIINFSLFSTNSPVGSITSSGVKLIEVGSKTFSELSSSPLEYARLNVPSPEGSGSWDLYYIKGYGEYVMPLNDPSSSAPQKYLIYTTNGGKGTKPTWFDSAVSSLN